MYSGSTCCKPQHVYSVIYIYAYVILITSKTIQSISDDGIISYCILALKININYTCLLNTKYLYIIYNLVFKSKLSYLIYSQPREVDLVIGRYYHCHLYYFNWVCWYTCITCNVFSYKLVNCTGKYLAVSSN